MFRGTSAKRYALKQESLIFTTRMNIIKIAEKMEKQDNEFMVTNFDSDSDDAYSSSEKEDDGGKM